MFVFACFSMRVFLFCVGVMRHCGVLTGLEEPSGAVACDPNSDQSVRAHLFFKKSSPFDNYDPKYSNDRAGCKNIHVRKRYVSTKSKTG